MNPEHLEELAALDCQHLLEPRQLELAAQDAIAPTDVAAVITLAGYEDESRSQVIAYRMEDWELLVLLKDMSDNGVTRLEDQLAVELAPGELKKLGEFLVELSSRTS